MTNATTPLSPPPMQTLIGKVLLWLGWRPKKWTEKGTGTPWLTRRRQ